MANYTSHAIMANEVYKQLKDINKIEINNDYLNFFSMGQDFTFTDSNLFDETHNLYSKAFFINTIKYIKENKIYENEVIMSYLYGHIVHYALDTIIHPYVYYITDNMESYGIITPHNVVECYVDKYMLSNNEFWFDYLNNNLLDDIEIKNIINYTYDKTYKTNKKISSYYKYTQKIVIIINKLIQLAYKKENLFSKLKSKYNIEYNNFINKKRDEWVNPLTGLNCNDSIDDIINKSISKSLEMIYLTNMYIYNESLDTYLDLAFEDLSYNTGENYKKGNKFVYAKTYSKHM